MAAGALQEWIGRDRPRQAAMPIGECWLRSFSTDFAAPNRGGFAAPIRGDFSAPNRGDFIAFILNDLDRNKLRAT